MYLEKEEDDRKDYSKVKEVLIEEFTPEESCFQAMREFEYDKLFPGESPHVFLFHLKRLLSMALPALTGEAKEQMLVHHFI